MDITFPIIRYTKARNIERWARMGRKRESDSFLYSLKKIFKEASEQYTKDSVGCMATIVFILFITLSILIFKSLIILTPFLILAGIFGLVFIIDLIEEASTFSSYKHFHEKIIFSTDSISIISPLQEENHSFLYKEINKIHLLYKAVNDKNLQGHIAIFTWEKEDKHYEYIIPLQVYREEEMLMNVLADLYEKKIKIHETNEDGEELHLLRLTTYKGSNIDKKYIDLIEEIGEKED